MKNMSLETMVETGDYVWLRGYKHRYAADKNGNIWGKMVREVRPIKYSCINSGYLICTLRSSENIRTRYGKTMLAGPKLLDAWIQKPKNHVLHYKDGDKWNLKLENLEWIHKDNIVRRRKVPVAVTYNGETIIYDNITDARRSCKFLQSTSELRKYAETGEEYKGYTFKLL